MQHPPFFALAGLVLCVPAAAQPFVSPSSFATTEGPFFETFAIGGTATPAVHLAVYDEMAGRAGVIKGVAFRRDAVAANTTLPASSMLVSVFLSTAQTTASNPSATLAANHGSDRAAAARFALVSFPQTVPTGFAEPFDYRLPFSTPFAFGGGGPLCVEIVVHSRTQPSAIWFDNTGGANPNPAPAFARYGTGCITTGSTLPVEIQPSASGNWAGNAISLRLNGFRLPKSSLVSIALGTSQTAFGPLPLPFVLPGTQSAPSGACTVLTDYLLTIPTFTDAAGNFTFSIGMNVTPNFSGLTILSQVVAPDATANSFGLVFSDGARHHIVAPHPASPIGTVYVAGSQGPTGTVRKNSGLVVEFDM